MIVAFEILRNSGSSGYHNETTINCETGSEQRFDPSKTAETWSFGAMRRRLAVVTFLSGRDE